MAKYFEKKNIPIFSANIPKNVQKHIFEGNETIKKNYEVVFKIWAKKKKLSDHPIHPIHPSIHPSVRQYTGREYLKAAKISPSAHQSMAYGKNTYNVLILSPGSTMVMQRTTKR